MASRKICLIITALSRIIVASRADVDQCLASRAPRLRSVIANATTSYAISFAADSEEGPRIGALQGVPTMLTARFGLAISSNSPFAAGHA